ncbi:hypothetical protein GBAR_LOCUS18438 [Geodia barretti]|uniref:Fibronectin type-III domain-containing protein n=1 Tax=Geodia barretti TaxID=519541 RepID=A0AA35WSX9_GEOBA|nr:hypothetical protein GBAR_LOCUS18438 [Geodia barretti]
MSMIVLFNLHEEKMNVSAVPLMLLIFTMVESVRIIEHPETKRVPEGGTVTFECSGEGEMGWYVDDQFVWGVYRTQLQQDGFSFRSSHYPTYSDLTMTAPAKISRNGTKIKCEAYSTSEVAFSNTSWLWIIGPPLPPNVTVELSSWNTMRLSWNAPFTAEGFPIDKYIVFTTNSSTDERTRTEFDPTDGNESLTIVDTPCLCHSLLFEVIAESSAGTSSATEVSGAFPVAVTGFHVEISVTLTVPELIPEAKISFQPPQVCAEGSGVAATYTLELRTVSGVLVHRTVAEYHESILIEETQIVPSCSSYTLNVTVSVSSFPLLGTHSNITIFDVPIGCPTTERSEGSGVLIPVLLGAVALVVVLLTLLIGAGLAVVCLQLRRRKTVNMRNSTCPRVPLMTDNPIYDDNHHYDVIPESCGSKPHSQRPKKRVSSDFRYSATPTSLSVNKESRQHPLSLNQNSLSTETPSPSEVDAILRNTFAGSLSPPSQQCVNGGGAEGEVYDTLSEKPPPVGGEGRVMESEKEDCYVLMNSSAV